MKTFVSAVFGAVGSALLRWRLALLLWAVNAIAALAVAVPLAETLDRALAHHPVAPSLLGAFDEALLVDLENVHAGTLATLRDAIDGTSVLWILLWLLVSAGVVASVADRKSHRSLFAAAGRYGHRFVWLFVCTLVVLPAVWWANVGLTRLANWYLVDVRAYGASSLELGWTMTAKTVLMLLLLGLVLVTQRIARVRVVMLDERFMPLTWLRSFGSVLRHLPLVGFASLAALAAPALVIAAYWLAKDGLVAGTGPTAGLFGERVFWRYLLLAQACQLLFQWALVYRTSVEVRLWPALAPPAPPPAPRSPGAPPPVVREIEDEPPAALRGEGPNGPSDEDLAAARAGDAMSAPPAQGGGDGGEAHGGRSALGLLLLGGTIGALGVLSHAYAGGDATLPAPAAPLAVAAQATSPPPQQADEPAAVRRELAPRTPVLRNRYVMDARLDPQAASVDVSARATFINATDEPVSELWMHLYAAAFGNTRSTWMRESRWREEPAGVGVLRRGPEGGGTIDVRAVRDAAGADLGPRTTIDDTLMRIDLAEPVRAGDSVTVVIEFETTFPRRFARMGKRGPHIDGMQWFPKFCVHDSEDGWIVDPFHNVGEFFADFGSYEVTFRAPAGSDLGTKLEATGVRDPVTTEDGVEVARFAADDVHDFAFCYDPNFLRATSTFTYVIDGTEYPVEIVYLHQPYATPKVEQVLRVVETCMRLYGEWWMPYPYERLVIDGLPHAHGGGMEYPMLFTISQRFPNHWDWLVEHAEDPASVTVHEFGHEFWYGILASNEFDEAWLDEGINTWATAEVLERHWPEPSAAATDALTAIERHLVRDLFNGAHGLDLPGLDHHDLSLQEVVGWRASPFHDTPPDEPAERPTLLGWSVPSDLRFGDAERDFLARHRDRYYEDARVLPLAARSREFHVGYGPLVYSKTALMLESLERHVGWEAMRELMGAYVERHAFTHPTGEDFLAVVSEQTGGAHDAWLRQLVETTDTVDFAVEHVATRRELPEAGFARQTRPGDPTDWVGPTEPPEDDEPGLLAGLGADGDGAGPGGDAAPGGERPWFSRYVVRNLGGIEAPVVVEARFADGTVERDVWDGTGGLERYEHETPSRLVEVRVDPERLFAIELDRTNNGWRDEAATRTVCTLGAIGHFWTQCWLNGWSMLF